MLVRMTWNLPNQGQRLSVLELQACLLTQGGFLAGCLDAVSLGDRAAAYDAQDTSACMHACMHVYQLCPDFSLLLICLEGLLFLCC